MHNLPPLNALKAFEATARLRSFTKAACELNVTRAAVSQQVKALEQYLNATLFERTASQLQLTQVASDYLVVVNQVFASLSSTTEHLFSRHQRQQLVLHVAHSFCVQWLMPRLADFYRQYPQASFKISTTASTMPNASDMADIEIINGYGGWISHESRPLTDERWIVVANPYWLKRFPQNTLSCLANAPKLATGGYQETWQSWFDYQTQYHSVGQKSDIDSPLPTFGCLKRKVIAEFEHSALAIEAAINQLGVLLVRDLLVSDPLKQGELVQVGSWSMPSRGQHHLVVRKKNKPLVPEFANWLLTCFSPD
ncbi:LysR family transcriptional regulator [Vibrio sp. SM6]|uniref:LysR family transcriptional regulator n=1 Tax=Vibrio agarilyticus TaxID=2726741 RepID=A0A7X8TQA5_9VIBR|nr:LysR substrate-binding domain-containing protein [Vibrio agarilyticus]NLS12965.1 LysR family transcriptional regulator [Vibrio agarilyticus]